MKSNKKLSPTEQSSTFDWSSKLVNLKFLMVHYKLRDWLAEFSLSGWDKKKSNGRTLPGIRKTLI